jgi:hypothetical protein
MMTECKFDSYKEKEALINMLIERLSSSDIPASIEPQLRTIFDILYLWCGLGYKNIQQQQHNLDVDDSAENIAITPLHSCWHKIFIETIQRNQMALCIKFRKKCYSVRVMEESVCYCNVIFDFCKHHLTEN